MLLINISFTSIGEIHPEFLKLFYVFQKYTSSHFRSFWFEILTLNAVPRASPHFGALEV